MNQQLAIHDLYFYCFKDAPNLVPDGQNHSLMVDYIHKTEKLDLKYGDDPNYFDAKRLHVDMIRNLEAKHNFCDTIGWITFYKFLDMQRTEAIQLMQR